MNENEELKTEVELVVEEYENKLKEQKENYERMIAELKEQNAHTIKAILSGERYKEPELPKTDEDEEQEKMKSIIDRLSNKHRR